MRGRTQRYTRMRRGQENAKISVEEIRCRATKWPCGPITRTQWRPVITLLCKKEHRPTRSRSRAPGEGARLARARGGTSRSDSTRDRTRGQTRERADASGSVVAARRYSNDTAERRLTFARSSRAAKGRTRAVRDAVAARRERARDGVEHRRHRHRSRRRQGATSRRARGRPPPIPRAPATWIL